MEVNFPERIVPDTALRFDYIDHLARYDYIKLHIGDKDVLDCGCGNGYGSFDLASLARSVNGIDYANEAIQYAKSHYNKSNLEYSCMDSQDLAFPSSLFDIICSFDVIEHVPSPSRYLREISRVLRPNGIAFISTPNRKISSPGLSLPLNPFHLKEYDLHEFNEMLSGFFLKVEILGEFEDHTLQNMKAHTSRLRTIWRLTDSLNLRDHIPINLRQRLLSSVVNILSGVSLDTITEKNVLFKRDNIETASTFFAICER